MQKDLIEKLAEFIAKKILKHVNDYSKAEELVSKKRNREVKYDYEDALKAQIHGLRLLISEFIKLILVLFLSHVIGIMLPTLIVLISFSISRMFLGGRHLSSSTKCLVFTTSLIILTGYFANIFTLDMSLFNKVLIYSTYGFVLQLLSTTKGFVRLLRKIN